MSELDFAKIALFVRGGSGKSIMATAVVRSLKRAHPRCKITVVTAYPDVFKLNPCVDRVLTFRNPANFYEDYIRDSRTLVIDCEPYLCSQYIYKKKHLVDVWCDVAGVPCDSHRPELFLTRDEVDKAAEFLDDADRPILLMQITGGNVPKKDTPQARRDAAAKMYKRDLPVDIAQSVVNRLRDRYSIYLIKGPTQPSLDGVIPFSAPLRDCYALIPHASKLLVIDSFMQHAAAALGKQAVVVWGGTSPAVLGYDSHVNITRDACPEPFCHRPNTFLFDRDIQGNLWECPHGHACLQHDVGELVAAVGEPAEKRSTQLLLDVFGIKRTGNHPFITWVLANGPDMSAHYNLAPQHCVLKWRQGPARGPVDRAMPLETQYPPFSREEASNGQSLGIVIVSREDADLQKGYSTRGLRKLGTLKRRRPVLILRDAFNHLASIYKRYVVDGQGGKNGELSLPGYIAAWKQYAHEFLGETSFLRNPLRVNYNRWFSDEAYREELAGQLGLPSSSEGLGEITRWGSSFGDTGDARLMKVLERWHVLRNDEKFRQVFNDAELVALSRRIFGDLPGVRDWLTQPRPGANTRRPQTAPVPAGERNYHGQGESSSEDGIKRGARSAGGDARRPEGTGAGAEPVPDQGAG